jgi:hypothetical protein
MEVGDWVMGVVFSSQNPSDRRQEGVLNPYLTPS